MNNLHLKMIVPSIEESKEIVCAAVISIAEYLVASEDEINCIRTSILEVMDNCIRFAYPNKVGPISVLCKILKNNVLSVVIKDEGVGISDVEQALQPLFTTGGENHSGLGFSVIAVLMSEVKISSKPGKGTTINMKKRIELV